VQDRHRLSHRSEAQFDPANWTKEGDGLMASSRKMRAVWAEHRANFADTIAQHMTGSTRRSDDWPLLTGLPRASMLLLGYAAEMYLKAGIAKAYRNCATSMFERDIKHRFGHKLVEMAQEVAFRLTADDRQGLDGLKDMVLVDARYPVFVPDGATYATTVNAQTSRIWSQDGYDTRVALVGRICDHVALIDADSSDAASFGSFTLDGDGYLAFRTGGHLPPRITYRVSSDMRPAGETAPADVRALLNGARFREVQRYWDRAWIYEDGISATGRPKTYRRQRPSPG